jgi:hypothetical protein
MIDLTTSERHISLTEAAQGRIPLARLEQFIEDGYLKVYWDDDSIYLDRRALETLNKDLDELNRKNGRLRTAK